MISLERKEKAEWVMLAFAQRNEEQGILCRQEGYGVS